MKLECRNCHAIYLYNPHDYAMRRCPECGSHEYSTPGTIGSHANIDPTAESHLA